MKKNTWKKIACTILTVLIAACTTRDVNYSFSGGETVPMTTFNLNGSLRQLVVDTGAETSILSEGYWKRNMDGFVTVDSLRFISVTAQGYDTLSTYKVRGMVNDTIPTVFTIMGMEQFSTTGNNGAVGILGLDFIKENHLVIDFQQHKLTNFASK